MIKLPRSDGEVSRDASFTNTSTLVMEMPRKPATARRPSLGAVERPALQPQLPYRNLDDIVQKVSGQFFHHTYNNVTWCFVIQKTLACIFPASRRIQIHNVLNATDVPDDVFVTIIFHEMLHLEIQPIRRENGKWNMHPPEFSKAEQERSPYLDASWDWLHMNLPLRHRPRLQCTDVVPNIMRLTPQQREWARKQFGIELPRVIRSDEPSSRLISIQTWRIAVAAYCQSSPRL